MFQFIERCFRQVRGGDDADSMFGNEMGGFEISVDSRR